MQTAKIIEEKIPHLPNPEENGRLMGDLVNRRILRLRFWRVSRSRFVCEFFWWRRTLSQEIRSFCGRIQTVRDRRKGCPPNDLGSLFEETLDGQLVLSVETQDRTASIQSLSAKFPWVSDSDVMLALYGWEKGRQFSRRTEDSRSTEMETTS